MTRSDDTLIFTDLTTFPIAGPIDATARRAALEQAVLDHLRTPLTYSIESNHLELRATRTTGLSLSAPRPDGNPRGTC
ncbi:hypothetical protein [Kribbella jejuensis]|uniref:hypothetical protein n=1 Tax=Kribbella jejuensis TaxID=236068 RepID=UPI00307ED5CA